MTFHLKERKGNKGVQSAQRKSLAVQSGTAQANKNIEKTAKEFSKVEHVSALEFVTNISIQQCWAI